MLIMQTIDNMVIPTEDDKYLTYQYLKKHLDLVIHITPKIKNGNVLNVLSFCGTEYDQFFSNYDWDTLENMLRYLLIEDYEVELELVNNLNELIIANNTDDDNEEAITDDSVDNIIKINTIDLTEHFFKKFKRFQNVIPVFYTNILTDFEDNNKYKYLFSRFFWFDYVEGNHTFPPFFDNSCTNYGIIIKMFIQILKHFDDWYWNNYEGDNVVETSLVEDVVDIYKTIEKFYYADKNQTAKEIDETFESAKLSG